MNFKRAQARAGFSIAVAILTHFNMDARAQTQAPRATDLPSAGVDEKTGAATGAPEAVILPPKPAPVSTAPGSDVASSGEVAPPANVQTQLEGFSALRHALLEAIAGARQRVWLTSEYLTDGEIVTALYLAQYRKLDVKVLLGHLKAQSPLSRLNYLKQQKVPVWLRPDSFKPGSPSAVLADDALFLVDGELDSQARARIFTVTQTPAPIAQRFANDFNAAAALAVPAVSRALPLVGRANTGGAAYGSSGAGSYSKISSDGAYRYGRAPEPRPPGVSAKLPKQTKIQERSKAHTLPPDSSMSK